jgi:hypothetical protein
MGKTIQVVFGSALVLNLFKEKKKYYDRDSRLKEEILLFLIRIMKFIRIICYIHLKFQPSYEKLIENSGCVLEESTGQGILDDFILIIFCFALYR